MSIEFKPTSKLTGKQRAMVIERLKDPKAYNHEIVSRAGYKTASKHTMAQQYVENMKKPEIRNLLAPVVNEVEEAIITTVRRYKNSNELEEVKEAMNNARWIHDKVRGKATQVIQSTSTVVNLNLDLTEVVE